MFFLKNGYFIKSPSYEKISFFFPPKKKREKKTHPPRFGAIFSRNTQESIEAYF